MSRGWEDRQERTRAEVLAAVGQIVAADGLDRLTMRKLADRAGVAVATLYNQFGDRSGVLVAFVNHGLDELELALDEQPAAAPIDGTRVLLDTLDHTLVADEAVWRPVLAALKSGPGVDGMGAVGDRVVRSIEADLAKAQAADMFLADCDVERLARHVFTQRMRGLERWAQNTIGWEQYRSTGELALELSLAAVLVEPHRTDALRRAGIIAGP
jgi:AcrR family transcriptional regulator